MTLPVARHVALVSTLLASCAHLPPPAPSPEEGQRAAGVYLKTLRWEGARASAQLVVPELQPEYLARVKAEKLEDKLKVTEFETRDMSRRAADALEVGADLSWYVEPEVTVHHALITLHMRFRGTWLVEGIEGGPLELAPLVPVADGGAP